MLCEKCQEKPATVHITRKSPSGESVHHFCEACAKPTLRTEIAMSPNPNPPESEPQINTAKRYDVYCMEPRGEIVVYRNALFKGAATLLPPPGGRMHYPGYIELEQANGQSIFVPRSHIVRFCEPGTTLVGERLEPQKPNAR
jgi:hypothetical protein